MKLGRSLNGTVADYNKTVGSSRQAPAGRTQVFRNGRGGTRRWKSLSESIRRCVTCSQARFAEKLIGRGVLYFG